MNRRGQVLVVLLGGVLLSGLLWSCTSGTAGQHADELGEVTAVLDSAPGTVVVHVLRHERTTAWRVDDSGEAVEWIEGEVAAGTPQARQCQQDLCYRVPGDALRVEQSTDGGTTFGTVWEVSGEAYTRLGAKYPRLGDPAQHLSSRSLVVHAVPGGHVVFVADGRDGLLYRDVRGAWHRLGSPDSGEGCCYYEPPPSLAAPSLTGLPLLAGAGTAAVILLFGLVPTARRRAWRGLPVVAAIAALGGLNAGIAATLQDVGMFPGPMYSVPLILAVTAGGGIFAHRLATTDGAPLRRAGTEQAAQPDDAASPVDGDDPQP
ncbi:hypothetical protein GCM10009827_070940 [Dactylosporangium maewongense]|uniref:Lipoprotein n=1 Tax=Dactylosporangium maewongense TaxID=634393 RepID=A0ABN2BL06_9ACTN